MPELPEITIYLEALAPRVLGQPLEAIRLQSISLLRTWDPPLHHAEGRTVTGLRRMGKRIVFELDEGLFLVLHLMISGRLRWRARGAAVPRKGAHGAFDFPTGTLLLTEAASHKRSTLHLVRGEAALQALDPGGIDPLRATSEQFRAAITRENHTLKRALTDPRILSGIGNAHSDEILFAARLSPLKRTARLSEEESAMQVHGRFREPCVTCGSPVQRIVHGEHETNYCAACQTEGRLLKDRAMSKLLGDDWPETLAAPAADGADRRRAHGAGATEVGASQARGPAAPGRARRAGAAGSAARSAAGKRR